MRFVMFYHSLVSDWNHGNAHFLRGIATELMDRGHQVDIFEPEDGWSYSNLVKFNGERPLREFETFYPRLESRRYRPETLDIDAVLDSAAVVIVHEWNSAELVAKLGEHRGKAGKYRLYFHDTHHRSVTDPSSLGAAHLKHYDGVLVFGESLARRYRNQGWSTRAWVWHEAADTRVFHPCPAARAGDLVWIGNWGDGERSRELHEFIFQPVRNLRLRSRVYGVRYPEEALAALKSAGAEYSGWIANFHVPPVFGAFPATVHVPRRPYREQLPGVPTIRVFEALACGIPLICAPWDDCEGLFTPGKDYLVARDGAEMTDLLSQLMRSPALGQQLAAHGLKTIRQRHSCSHRADQLLGIVQQ